MVNISSLEAQFLEDLLKELIESDSLEFEVGLNFSNELKNLINNLRKSKFI